jgi:hypothetical protein
MRIVLAGGRGFLGRGLAAALSAENANDVVILSRSAAPAPGRARTVVWTPNGETGPWASEVDGAGAVVNLAGESIAGRRWSAAYKQRILDSRVLATRSLVNAIQHASMPPTVFISASAVGYYGPRGPEILPESAGPGSDFLAQVCVQWEQEAVRATAQTRVVLVRTGLPLEKDGGALPPMLLPFKLGLGGPIGSGRQYWPWIHRRDWTALVRWAIATPTISGPINATAPAPVTNAELTRALGRAMHRPAFMPAPAFALRILLGEMADALLLSGQRAVPAKAEQAGFEFEYARVDDALGAIFDR